MTVADNLIFAAKAARRAPQHAHTAMERLGLAGRLHDLTVNKLSAGQRRRVALAAVVARQPELWLLDEPHAGLDAAGRDLLDGLIREAVQQHGATVVLASHELDRSATLAHRRITVAGGRVNNGALAADPQPREPTNVA